MKIKEITPAAFLEEEMRYQLKEAKIEVSEEELTKGLTLIYEQLIIPHLPKLINKKGLLSVPGFFIIAAA